MKTFTMHIAGGSSTIVAILKCDNCGLAVSSWTGFVGLLHVPMDDADGDSHEHICDEQPRLGAPAIEM